MPTIRCPRQLQRREVELFVIRDSHEQYRYVCEHSDKPYPECSQCEYYHPKLIKKLEMNL